MLPNFKSGELDSALWKIIKYKKYLKIEVRSGVLVQSSVQHSTKMGLP